MNFAQYTIQTLKVIAVWQVKNYVNKMQEKDSKIIMMWEKIIPENYLCTWENILINGQRHWKNESKAHTGPMNYTWIYSLLSGVQTICWDYFISHHSKFTVFLLHFIDIILTCQTVITFIVCIVYWAKFIYNTFLHPEILCEWHERLES